MSVVAFDLPKNREALANFVFSSHKKTATDSAIKKGKKAKNK